MRAAGAGAVVNFTSISYMMGTGRHARLHRRQGRDHRLTRTLARELGPDGVRVNAVAPGWVLTEKQLEKWASPEALEEHLARACLKTHLKPADMVAPTLFLASRASGAITGQTIAVDGGVVTVSA
jgi:NAD(P)-dependent dehydrogenase (short-subunit alcohol dehydrogenase family)